MRHLIAVHWPQTRSAGCVAAAAIVCFLGTASQATPGEKAESPGEARARYHLAAEQLRHHAQSNSATAELYLNLGNAHYLADELPQAILAYREGLRQNPVHSRLWENLEAVRDQVGYPGGLARHRPAPDGWPIWLPRLAPGVVLWAAVLIHALAWAAAWLWLIIRGRKLATLTVAGFLIACALGVWWGYLDFRIDRDQRQTIVVVALNGTTLRRGNGSLYGRHPDLPVVNRGMEAMCLNERGGWVQVQFPGGDVGWLPRAAVVGE
jgi:hypothetical protein